MQVSGTSMGTRIGPNYANIFMGLLESRFLDTQNLKPLYYKRYIDDIFMIWQHSETELLTFIEAINLAHSSISLSHSYSRRSVSFLDVTVTASEGSCKRNSIENRLIRDSICISTVVTLGTVRPQYLTVKLTALGEFVQTKPISTQTARNLKPHF